MTPGDVVAVREQKGDLTTATVTKVHTDDLVDVAVTPAEGGEQYPALNRGRVTGTVLGFTEFAEVGN